jgi:hypothetical protein
MGAWWYVRPRLHAALRFHLRREAWQARASAAAAAAAAPASGSAEADAALWGYAEDDAGVDATRLSASRPEVVVRYVGRPPAASPATASFKCAGGGLGGPALSCACGAAPRLPPGPEQRDLRIPPHCARPLAPLCPAAPPGST